MEEKGIVPGSSEHEDLDELRFAAAVQWYYQGRLSGSKAAQIVGMTRLEFLDELARRRLDVVKVDLDRLREEIGAA